MSAVKALQQWCRVRCDGYRDVSITNMTTSFRDGLAFCALIHKHRPDLIDFDSLRKGDVYENNKLAFAVAEEQLGIPALLDAEDMVALKVPDRLSILTYVSQYYNYFHGRSPIGGLGGIKRPADDPVGEPTGKKNQPVVSKVFPSSGPARENSPPPSANITRPSASPRLTRNATKDATVEKPHKTGTLSNKCVSCNQVVHLVQRHLVDGKLYHRNCAKSLSPANPATLYRRLPTTPLPDSTKTNTTAHVPSRTGPSWLTEKPSHPASSGTSTPPSQPSSSPSRPSLNPSQPSSSPSQPPSGPSRPFWSPSQPPSGPSQPPSGSSRPSWSPSQPPSGPSQPSKSPSRPSSSPSRPSLNPSQPPSGSSRPSWSPSQPASSPSPAANESQTSVVSKPAAWRTAADSTFTTATTSVITKPTPTPRTSTTAAKTLQSKLKFFTSNDTAGDAEKKTTTASIVVNKGPNVSGKVQEATAGQAVTVVVNIGGLARKEADVSSNAGGERGKAAGGGGDSKAKALAAAFISKKLSEENNNNNSKPPWMNVVLKKSDQHPQVETPKKETQPPQVETPKKETQPHQVETPKKETGAVRGRKRLKADPAILADLQTPIDPRRTPSPVGVGGLRARTPDRGASKPGSAAPNTPASENESPADWRSKLKPIAKPAGPSQSPKLGLKGAGKPQVSEPSPSAHPPSISVTPPAAKGFLNGQKDTTANGTKSESTIPKTKPDYILKEDIMRELQEIEDSVNEWERRGVELEVKLRSSEEEGKDDAVMDELMVEWFNLIRNKQVAMRRESELVYIGRTQDLEEEQPSVESELRRLMEKPEHLKTSWDRQREEELMAKLVGIVNDRNAIVEGLDEDRLREEEEDEELNKMMMNFSLKKDKPKKKPKLFGWGKKKEG